MNDNTDPLWVLHGDELPVQPDPAFAERLRRRLESALRLPNRTEGVEMSGTDTALAAVAPRPAALPYLAVGDARAAIGWYADAFGATLAGEPIVMDDGRIGHAELTVSGGVLYLADEFPEMGLKAPDAEHVSVSLMLQVSDTDAALRRAHEHGARVQREPYDAHGSRTATIIDPFGHRWMLSGPVPRAGALIEHGDVGYVSLWTRDTERAAAFYGHVLGWTYDPATRQVTNTDLPTGIFAGDGPATLFCCYAVDDLDAARQSIIAAGGTPGATTTHDFGTTLDATDPLGNPFAVFTPSRPTPRPALNGTGPRELSYITHEVTDSGRFREFYGRVLSWTFEPGRIEDGWAVNECRPMTGIGGGSDRSVTVPMWTVSDIDDAVRLVREAGGSVRQEPNRQPYGLMAECVDDQGARFYLGQF
ncbi:VOC family protein [Mycolicibacterium monacense]|uniref:Glyoxalase n=1 Tax=Mycolicibacterium monacense TaxID=85693 RepID=A0AAD1N0Y6_MYCMB|nr:VOC family protein [Mycolicibacterium monacense]MDA4101898.1 glyoxalase [Mycolicibacterium monacense DSM 44395]OBF55792.1 glyoxalase [Mycolicibacterium monacense]ORB15531.1 glyoxalase [Mycolicibacterium monacense DSM 44395]QHP84836.1 glyoxalase [Mycolicibacterium monacense DSM 44395]BBZ62350.1 glyoxalase [Mycolicibacterium monacense]